MKKLNFLFQAFCCLALFFTSCQSDNLNVLPEEQSLANNTQLSRAAGNGTYNNGVFVLSEGDMMRENGTLGFISPDGTIENTIFQTANIDQGQELGNVAQDLYIANGMIYIICQNGDSFNGKGGSLVVANATTMKLEKFINGFGTSYGSSPTHLVVVDNEKAYVRADNGLIRVNLTSNEVIYMPEVTNPAKTKMAYFNNKVFVAQETSVVIIDPNADAIANIIGVEGGKIAGIAKGRDNILWVLTIENNTTGHLTKINTDTEIPEDYYTLNNASLAADLFIPSVGLCCYTGETNDILYFRSNSWAPTDVYRFEDNRDYNQNAEVIYRASPGSDIGMIYGELGVDPTNGDLYFGYIKGYSWDFLINGVVKMSRYNEITIYDEIDARFCAGIYFTSQF